METGNRTTTAKYERAALMTNETLLQQLLQRPRLPVTHRICYLYRHTMQLGLDVPAETYSRSDVFIHSFFSFSFCFSALALESFLIPGGFPVIV
jgi:hypothetical protein